MARGNVLWGVFTPGGARSSRLRKLRRGESLTLGYKHIIPTEFQFGSPRSHKTNYIIVRSRNASCAEDAAGDGLGDGIGEIKLGRAVGHQRCPRLEIVRVFDQVS